MWETWVQSLELRRSPGEGNGNPLQYFCLENPMDRGACQTLVHRVTKSQTQLSDVPVCITHSKYFIINLAKTFSVSIFSDNYSFLRGNKLFLSYLLQYHYLYNTCHLKGM